MFWAVRQNSAPTSSYADDVLYSNPTQILILPQFFNINMPNQILILQHKFNKFWVKINSRFDCEAHSFLQIGLHQRDLKLAIGALDIVNSHAYIVSQAVGVEVLNDVQVFQFLQPPL